MVKIMSSNDFLPISIEGINLTINAKACLHDINLQINDNGITVIMGSNGSGKTLLLKLIAGVIAPTQGIINWHRQPQPPELTMVPAKAVLLNRSVGDNIALPLHHAKNKESTQNKKGDIDKIINEALAWADIDYLKHRHAKSLSTGEQQLVALARAWALKPNILLLDEITANLDPVRTQKMTRLVQDLSQFCKIILTTHSIKQAKVLASNVLLMEQGKVLLHAGKDSFFDSNEFQHFLALQ